MANAYARRMVGRRVSRIPRLFWFVMTAPQNGSSTNLGKGMRNNRIGVAMSHPMLFLQQGNKLHVLVIGPH